MPKLYTFRRKIKIPMYPFMHYVNSLEVDDYLFMAMLLMYQLMYSFANTLPKPINESQTIPIKLKSKLSSNCHYQFHNVRLRKVLEAAKHLVKTSELFQKEHNCRCQRELTQQCQWCGFK